MDNQPPMSRNAKIVIAVSCLLFLALRLAITFTAVDRIMHAALEEQQIAGWADSELHGGFRDYAFIHGPAFRRYRIVHAPIGYRREPHQHGRL